MDQPALDGHGRCIGAVADSEFAEQVIDVGFDGRLGDEEIGSDLLVCAACDNALEYGEFTGSKILRAHAVCELFGDRGGNTGLSGMGYADRVEKVIDGNSLEQIGLGSCLKGAEDIFVAIEGGQNDK